MFKIIKRFLIKRWAKEIREAIAECTDHKNLTYNGDKNIAGLGGQAFLPYFISWTELSYQSKTTKNLKNTLPMTVRVQLFFEYFGPLEHWCDTNCTGRYYLWSDERGVFRAFIDPIDVVLWNLTFDGPMPTMKEIYHLVEINS